MKIQKNSNISQRSDNNIHAQHIPFEFEITNNSTESSEAPLVNFRFSEFNNRADNNRSDSIRPIIQGKLFDNNSVLGPSTSVKLNLEVDYKDQSRELVPSKTISKDTLKVSMAWKQAFPTWYSAFELKITNNSTETLKFPLIKFDVSGMNYSPYSEIRAYTGFTHDEDVRLPKIEGNLSDHLSTLKPNSSVTLTFGVNFRDKSDNQPLPKVVTINQFEIPVSTGGGDKPDIPDNKPDIPDNKPDIPDNKPDIPDNKPDVPDNKPGNVPLRWNDTYHIKIAPFIDITAWPTPKLIEDFNLIHQGLIFESHIVPAFTLGFITGYKNPITGKQAAHFGSFPEIYDANTQQTYSGDVTKSDYMKEAIKKIRENGGDIIMSFGGAANLPIEAREKHVNSTEEVLKPFELLIEDISEIKDIYLKTINNYQLKVLDFDFEGGFLNNTAALDRHIKAIKEVLKENPTLKISYTLPVDGAPGLMGLNNDGVNLLKKLHDAGIVPSLVNAMSMEFGINSDNSLSECVINSIEGSNSGEAHQQGLFKQIKNIFSELSTTEIYNMIGICPMFGVHNNGKIYNVEDQNRVNDYALGKKIALMSGWDVTRDIVPGKSGIIQSTGEFCKAIAKSIASDISICNVDQESSTLVEQQLSIEALGVLESPES